ncbi:glutathione S-transferase GstA-like [Littorina saxatilis]|uniref:Glutathione S-transferase n=1 Tax=Littorina saxatilis TaxID=31220 RepID=A0AAN9BWA4_9CAEN
MTTKIPKMKLWYFTMFRSTRCAWIIKELGLDDKVEYKFVPIGAPPPPPEREHYRKTVHPHSTVPALEIEGRPTMLESSAICMYLADLCGRLAPEPKDRAEYYDWIQYSACRLDEVMETLTWQWWFGTPEQQNPEVIAKAKAVADICLDKVEKTLQDRPYILGPDLTAADCVVGYNIFWASLPVMNKGILLEGRPNCQAYLERIKARPALQAALSLPDPTA